MNEGVRLIGVSASNLAPPLETVDLFRLVREKQVKAAAVMDAIQEKFGSMLCGKASGWRKKKGKRWKRKKTRKRPKKSKISFVTDKFYNRHRYISQEVSMVNEKRMRETFEELVRIYAQQRGTGRVRTF